MKSFLLASILGLSSFAVAQQQPPPPPNQAPPRSATDEAKTPPGESSSRDTRIDLSPPKDDAKDHPSSPNLEDNADSSDVRELHPFNPYRAAKDIEVGDYYYKIKNYKAAVARYQDALDFKENDAIAHFRMAQSYEKLGQPDEAIVHFKEYLRILPQGPQAKDARKSLAKLGEKQAASK